MIRGHIDLVSRTRVEGWLYADAWRTEGTRLLAYVDEECVGSGSVDIFRPDLAHAGLGDGRAGFAFAIQLKPSDETRSVEVRLEGGDVLLRQDNTCVVPRERVQAAMRRLPRDTQTLSFMLARGWISQSAYETLRLLGQFGVYRQSLPALHGKAGWTERCAYISATVGAVLEAHLQMDVLPLPRVDLWSEDLVNLRAGLVRDFPAAAPLIALWAPWASVINVSEGSHLEFPGAAQLHGIDHEFGENGLLWLNLDTAFHVPTGGFTCPVTALIPARRSAADLTVA